MHLVPVEKKFLLLVAVQFFSELKFFHYLEDDHSKEIAQMCSCQCETAI